MTAVTPPSSRHQRAPPPARRPEQVEHDAHEAVDRHLGHDAAHQGRDVARRGRVGERQPHVQRHEARLGAGADQREREDDGGDARRRRRVADRVERVAAGRARQQTEREQQRERAEARHQQVDVAGRRVAGPAMVRHHERPRRERHELPREEEREGVVGEHDEVHAGEEGGEERQHARGRFLVPAVAEAVQARRRAAEIDHQQEERRQRIEPEMGAQPRQADRQREHLRDAAGEEGPGCGAERDRGSGKGDPVDDRSRHSVAGKRDRRHARAEQRCNAPQQPFQCHGACPRSRS